MAHPDHARGLITFLFSFATIGIIVLVAVAIFWMDVAEVDARFAHAKDVITILIGVLVGFYFGTASSGNIPPTLSDSAITVAPRLSVSAVAVTPNSANAGDKITVSTKASGGSSPYQYDIMFDGSASGFDTSSMNIKGKSSATGEVSDQVAIPTEVPKRMDLTARIVMRDAGGAQASPGAVKLTISPRAAVGSPAESAPISGNK
jgi:hypothetical protein